MTPQRTNNILDLVRRSPLARTIIERKDWIKRQICLKRRKVWPTAYVAGLFGVSERLLWKWVERGAIPTYRRPTKRHRKGITHRAIQEFLRDLEQWASFGLGLTRPRKRPAWERAKEEARKLQRDEELTPAQFASRARVSVTTIYRLLAANDLHSVRPTDHRIKICRWGRRKKRRKIA